MPQREPTTEEIKARVKSIALWLGLALYMVIGFGGGMLFASMVHDHAWQEIFFSIWWLPSGFAAFYVKNMLEDYITGWVPTDPEN